MILVLVLGLRDADSALLDTRIGAEKRITANCKEGSAIHQNIFMNWFFILFWKTN